MAPVPDCWKWVKPDACTRSNIVSGTPSVFLV
jgi:hypothetical protein